MGTALLKAWSKKTNNKFIVVDPIQYKTINKIFKKKVEATDSLKKIKNFKLIDIVIFAIKPQTAPQVLDNIKNIVFNKKTIFISIVAGKKIVFFDNYLHSKNKFIRVMPNMPAMINQGMSCLFANKHVSNLNKKLINSLFLKIGKTLWLKKESDINKVTAISGSGPGYIFLIIDAFEKAAYQLGLDESSTRKLVHQTFRGSINLFLDEKKTALTLANNIAVKGGTTEAGLKIFKNKTILKKTFIKAVKAAYTRADKLGK